MSHTVRSVAPRILEVVINSPLSRAVTLGKRKASEVFASSSSTATRTPVSSPEPSAASGSDYEDEDEDEAEEEDARETDEAVEFIERRPRPPGSETPSERPYRCTHHNCTKAYTKPSRLVEHERSHTGERPYVCSTCTKSYLRESHLQAHSRSHLPESERPFACEEDAACGKRFWTTQHLNVHVASVHKGEKGFSCPEDGCEKAFAKHNQLKRHVAEAHCPPGTKPFRCDADGCTKSFPTTQKLRKHARVHQDNRYACIDSACKTPGTSFSLYFPNWTALQAHIREHHPPTCPYPECDNRTFASQKGLKGHLKVHEEREIEEALEKAAGDDSDVRPKKRRRGGEVGRDWACEVGGCAKTFKSKKALTTHHNITHLGRRDHACSHPGCGQKFGYKHLLQRHTAKAHSHHTSDAPTSEEDEPEASTSNIDWITGQGYTLPSAHRNTRRALVPCPWPDRFESEDATPQEDVPRCAYVFSRAYDLRRHLKADHGLELGKEEVDGWARGWRERHEEL